jgi:hypothetical protein
VAIYIRIRKIEEDSRYAWYSVCNIEEIGGTLIFDKITQTTVDFTLTHDTEIDRKRFTAMVTRAEHKIAKACEAKMFPLPDNLDWIA